MRSEGLGEVEGMEGLTINPMFLIERSTNDTRTETPCRVQTTPSIINTHHLRNEQRKTNTNRGNECRLVFLLCQHEDGKDQLGRQDSLDKDTTWRRRASSKRRSNIERGGEETQHHSASRDAAEDLSKEEADGANDGERTDENHAEGYGGVEESSGYTEEDPYIYHEGESEDDGDVELDCDVETGSATRGGVCRVAVDIGNLGTGKGEEEKHCCSNKFSDCGYEVYCVFLECVWFGWRER